MTSQKNKLFLRTIAIKTSESSILLLLWAIIIKFETDLNKYTNLNSNGLVYNTSTCNS